MTNLRRRSEESTSQPPRHRYDGSELPNVERAPYRHFCPSSFWIEMQTMDDCRLYNCARCQIQVYICRCCDRGNIYCPSCTQIAKHESRRRAGAVYQSTEKGKANHSARQQRYLEHKEAALIEKAKEGSEQKAEVAEETQDEAPPLQEGAKQDHAPIVTHPNLTIEKMTHQGIEEVREASLFSAKNPEVCTTSKLEKEDQHVQHHRHEPTKPTKPTESTKPTEPTEPTDQSFILCAFCGKPCQSFIRLDFIHTPLRKSASRRTGSRSYRHVA